jgi:hypothetical protein
MALSEANCSCWLMLRTIRLVRYYLLSKKHASDVIGEKPYKFKENERVDTS